MIRFSYFSIFSASFLNTFLSTEIETSVNLTLPFFIITDYDVRLIVKENSVSLQLFIP